MKFGFGIILFFVAIAAVGQNQNIPINFFISQKIEKNSISESEMLHSAIKPFNQAFVSRSVYFPVFTDTNVYYYDFTQKLFKENLLNIHEKNVDLVCDPLGNVAGGYSYIDTLKTRLFVNTRGVRVAGNITDKFSFETRFYETQVYYPSYLDSVADSRGVAFGLGRSKQFNTNGHDVGLSSGYFSYTPLKWLNFQFGQDKHFIGNGYRSLLLSDNPSNYPYLSFQMVGLKGKLVYKNINAWLNTLERLPASSTPEALFKTKNATFRYLSLKPKKSIEFGLFEGVIYQHNIDTIGEVPVHGSFYVPLIGFSALANASHSENKVLIGANINLSLIKSIQLFGQYVLDDFSRSGFQLGGKWFDVAGVKNSWLQIEYNKASPYLYSNTSLNYIQNYSHANQELAHPLGASFDELIMMAHYEFKRWSFSGKYFTATQKSFLGGKYGRNIFLANDKQNNLSDQNTVHWNYFGGEMAYNMNVKTRLQFFGSLYSRNEGSKNEWYWNLGIRTSLNNYYFEM